MKYDDPISTLTNKDWEDALAYSQDNLVQIQEWISEAKEARPSVSAQLQALLNNEQKVFTRIQLEQKLFGLNAKVKKTFSDAVEFASIPPRLRTLKNN